MASLRLCAALLLLCSLLVCGAAAQACPARCPGNGECQNSFAQCSCILNASEPVVTVLTSGSVIDVAQPFQVEAWTVYYTSGDACGSADLSLFVETSWEVLEDGAPLNASGAVNVGSGVAFPAQLFRSGHTYTFGATVTTVTGVVVSATASVQAVAVAARVTISQNGEWRRVPASSVEINAVVEDSAANASLLEWACFVTATHEACPANISDALVNGSASVTIPGPIPAGVYTVAVTYGDASDSLTLDVVEQNIPAAQIVVATQPVADQYFLSTQTLQCEGVATYDGAVAFLWYVNGAAFGGQRSLKVDASTLAVGSNNITLVAADANNTAVYGEATISITVLDATSATLTVVPLASNSSAAVALSDEIVLTALVSNATNSTQALNVEVTYQFGYFDRSAAGGSQMAFLTAFPQTLDSLTVVAPLPFMMLTDSASVEFFVVVLVGGVASATGRAELTVNAPAVNSAFVESLVGGVDYARNSSNLDGLLRGCTALSSFVFLSENVTLNAAVGAGITPALGAVSSSAFAPALTANRRSLMVVIASRVVFQNLVTDEQLILSVMEACVGAGVDNRASVDFDVENDGPAALAVLGRLPGSVEVVQVTRYLAASFAAAVTLGESATIATENITVACVAQSGGLIGGSNVTSNGTTLLFPSDVQLPGVSASSHVSAAAVVFTNSPVAAPNAVLLSLTADLTVVVDGVLQSVSNLSTPLLLSIAESANASAHSECMFFDETLQTWSTRGVQVTGTSGDAVSCTTTHLTLFGAFAPSGTNATQAPPNATTVAPHGALSSCGQVAVAAAAVVLSLLTLCA